MAFAVAPAVEFARGLPPQLGIALNPEGAVGVPLPPPAVAELCRAGRSPLDGPATGGRVRLYEPDWQEEPVDFLAAAGGEFAPPASCSPRGAPGQRRGRGAGAVHRCPTGAREAEAKRPDGGPRPGPGPRAGAVGGELVLLDAAQDPVGDWMLERVRPFYRP